MSYFLAHLDKTLTNLMARAIIESSLNNSGIFPTELDRY